MSRAFAMLNEKEVLALAMEIERNNADRLETLSDFNDDFSEEIQKFFLAMRDEELEHLTMLEEVWESWYGAEAVPEISEAEVLEVIEAADVNHGEHGLFSDLTIEDAVEIMRNAEEAAFQFYIRAAQQTESKELKKLYQTLADLEAAHMENFAHTPSTGEVGTSNE